ncbi:MAG: hypothetical protein ACOYOV_17730, partial [Bacteroidales bacterium]
MAKKEHHPSTKVCFQGKVNWELKLHLFRKINNLKTKPKQKINIITMGCSKNLVDSEQLMRQLKDNYDVVHESEK